MAQITESASVLADLFTRWDAQGDRYGDVLCGSAYARNGETWRNVITFFVPQKRGAGAQDLRVDYGDLLIIRESIAIADLKAILRELVEHGRLVISHRPNVELTVSTQASM